MKRISKTINVLKGVTFSLMAFAVIAFLYSCGPKQKLKIDGVKYTISLGEIKYDADLGLVHIQVLGNGEPLKNEKKRTRTELDLGGGQAYSSVSVSQPVGMQLIVEGRTIFFRESGQSSEDGLFTFLADAMPEKITVYTGTAVGKNVYFDAKTKQVISSEDYYPPIERQE